MKSQSQILMLSDAEITHEICGGGRRRPYHHKGSKGGNSLRISNSFNKVKIAAVTPINFAVSSNKNNGGLGVVQTSTAVAKQVNLIGVFQ